MHSDFRDMLCALNDRGVEFVVVGAHALAHHGQPRYTGDLDVLVRPSAVNARRVLAALEDFGAPLHDLNEDDLRRPGTVFQIGVPPLRIDVLTQISGVPFAEAWAGRVESELFGVPCAVLGRDEFIRNKRASGRTKDLLDIALLEEWSDG